MVCYATNRLQIYVQQIGCASFLRKYFFAERIWKQTAPFSELFVALTSVVGEQTPTKAQNLISQQRDDKNLSVNVFMKLL
jgi:hypothetical protein